MPCKRSPPLIRKTEEDKEEQQGEKEKNPHDLRSKDKQVKEEQEKKKITTATNDPPGATANPSLTTEMLQQSFQDFATTLAKNLEELRVQLEQQVKELNQQMAALHKEDIIGVAVEDRLRQHQQQADQNIGDLHQELADLRGEVQGVESVAVIELRQDVNNIMTWQTSFGTDPTVRGFIRETIEDQVAVALLPIQKKLDEQQLEVLALVDKLQDEQNHTDRLKQRIYVLDKAVDDQQKTMMAAGANVDAVNQKFNDVYDTLYQLQNTPTRASTTTPVPVGGTPFTSGGGLGVFSPLGAGAARAANRGGGTLPPNYGQSPRLPPSGVAFTGEDHEDWTAFRANFLNLVLFYDYSDVQAKRALRICVKGPATLAVDSIPVDNNQEDLATLLDKYEQLFMPPAASALARNHFEGAKQQQHEGLLNFHGRVWSLYVHAYPGLQHDTVLPIRAFSGGLRQARIKEAVLRADPQTYEAALVQAQSEQAVRESLGPLPSKEMQEMGIRSAIMNENGLCEIKPDVFCPRCLLRHPARTPCPKVLRRNYRPNLKGQTRDKQYFKTLIKELMEPDKGLDFGETDEEDEEQLVHITKDLDYEESDAEEDHSSCSSSVNFILRPGSWGSGISDGSGFQADKHGSDMEPYTSIETNCASRSSTGGSRQDPVPYQWWGTGDTTEEEEESSEEEGCVKCAMVLQSIEEEERNRQESAPYEGESDTEEESSNDAMIQSIEEKSPDFQ